MAYEPLHHKYRPQTFKELIGQEAIANTLSNALELEKIAPAYLFTGPRGTGKTSSARILAKSLNCLNYERPTPTPCGKCEVCSAIASGNALDVIEIDAASNTGVDNIREIIERSRFAPVQSRYKVYAIDECHMLSTAAFNALLKTLEEPPPQVVFILATTDPQRVLSTIISRCQRFDYRRIRLDAMISHLQDIAEQENIAITPQALTLTAQIANGGLRDAESLLDQLSLFPEEITVERIWDLVGAVPERDLLALLTAIRKQDVEDIVAQCRNLLDRGREPLVLLQNLAGFYLNLLIAKTTPHRRDLVAVTETCWQKLCHEAEYWQFATILQGQQQLKEGEIQIKQTTQPRLWLEVTLLGLLERVASSPNKSQQSYLKSQKSLSIEQSYSPIRSDKHLDEFHDGSVTANSVTKTNPAPLELKTPIKETTKQELSDVDTSITQKQTAPTPRQQNPLNNTLAETATKSTAVPNNARATTTSSNPPSAKTQETISIADPALIWQQVIDCIHPPMTQALLRQQCHLIELSDRYAVVGISSIPLKKMNQGKIPNIETAFAKVCQRPIKVTLEVASKQNFEQAQTSTLQTTTIEQTQTTATVVSSESSPTYSPQSIEPSQQSRPKERESPQVTSFQEQVKTNSVVVKTETITESTSNRDSDSPTAEVTPNFGNSDNFVKAVELVARKFDGEIIEFEDFLDRTTPASEATIVAETVIKQQEIVINREAISYYDENDEIPF